MRVRRSSLLPHKRGPSADFKKLTGIQTTEEIDQFGDQAGPTRLVTRPQACAVVSVEVFVEQDAILPIRIGLKFLRSSINWPPA